MSIDSLTEQVLNKILTIGEWKLANSNANL